MTRSDTAESIDTRERLEREALERSIPERFEQQVRRYPRHIAVKTTTGALTYAALNRAANRVAHTVLARRGEGQEPIALLLPQGVTLVAALLGVLKAGKIYVPLDAAFPPARTAVALEDAGAKLIVTNRELLTRARALADDRAEVLDLDEVDLAQPSENPALAVPPDAFAYIIYTSGSTGEPKGVVETHRNVLRYTRAFGNAWRMSAGDRVLLFSSPSTSGTVAALYPTLLNGATLYPVHPADCQASELADRVMRERITVTVGGAVFRTLAESLPDRARLPDLRMLHFGASALHAPVLERMREHLSPHAVVVNGLSLTEMMAICFDAIHRDTVVEPGLVPVGYPSDDVEILLLDEYGEEVAPREVGEITVKSRYLAPGFWRRPALTRATFLSDPNGGQERIYRTGDLGRFLPDGRLLVLGRKDAQVKVRGYRIELGEVEAAANGLESVREAAVIGVASGDFEGTAICCAVVPEDSSVTTSAAVRTAMRKVLPSYMVPSRWLVLPALPTNANGKIDRRRLRELFDDAYVLQAAHEGDGGALRRGESG